MVGGMFIAAQNPLSNWLGLLRAGYEIVVRSSDASAFVGRHNFISCEHFMLSVGRRYGRQMDGIMIKI